MERAIPGAQQHGDRIGATVGHGQVGDAIGIEIMHGQGTRTCPRRHEELWRLEGAIAVAQQHRSVARLRWGVNGPIVRHRQVRPPIAVEVGHRHRNRSHASIEGLWRLEGAIPGAQ